MPDSVQTPEDLIETSLASMTDKDYRAIAAQGLSSALSKNPLVIVPLILSLMLLGANTWVLLKMLEQGAEDRNLLTEKVVECYRSE